MPLTIPNRWELARLESTRVKQPVSHGPFQGFVMQGAFLLGRAKALIGSVAGLPKGNGSVSLFYVKAPGDRVVLIRVLLNEGTGTADRATVNARIVDSGGSTAGAELAGSGTSPLDGSVSIECARTDVRLPAAQERYWDVSSLTVGTRYEVKATTANSSGTAQGIYSLSAYVIPRESTDPASNPSTEPGVSEPFVLPRNPVFAGSASSSGDVGQGTERIVRTLDQARTAAGRYPLQIATVQTTTHGWSTSSGSFAAPDWNFAGSGTTPRWVTRARRLYSTSTANTVTAVIRYQPHNGSTDCHARFTRASDGTNFDVTCPAANNVATGTVSLKTSESNQEEAWTITVKTDAGTAYFFNFAFVDAES